MTKTELITQSKEMLKIAEKIQNESFSLDKRKKSLLLLNDQYHGWYRAAMNLFDASSREGEKQKFENEYEGSFWTQKILKFLTSALEESPLYDPEKPILNKWTYPYKRCFHEPLLKQCNILSGLEIDSIITNIQEWNPTICRILKVFIDKAENAETNHEKKLTYEYLAIFLIGAIDGLSIIGHDQRGASEEIDLWVANEAKDIFWVKHAGDPFIVECKNWATPVGVQEIRNLKGIMDSKNVSFSVLMSKHGITGDNYQDARSIVRNAAPNNRVIVVLDHADLLEMANGTHPTEVIQKKFYELRMA